MPPLSIITLSYDFDNGGIKVRAGVECIISSAAAVQWCKSELNKNQSKNKTKMNKTAICYAAVLLVVYFTLVFCEETPENNATHLVDTNTNTDTDIDSLINAGRDLLEFEGRTRRHRHRFWCKLLSEYLSIFYYVITDLSVLSDLSIRRNN